MMSRNDKGLGFHCKRARPQFCCHPERSEGSRQKMISFIYLLFALTLQLLACSSVLAQQLDTLNVSYASVTGSRIPLWIAKDAGLVREKRSICESRRYRCRHRGDRCLG